MFGTFIHDEYNFESAKEIRDALEDIASPNDTWGWASAGIYFFRKVDTHEILYIGLASNLGSRFAQHNGLVKFQEDGCKFNYLKEYLSKNEKIGLTVFVQSVLEQTKVAASINEDFLLPDANGIDSIKFTEGYLIRLHEIVEGKKPVWNIANGDKRGQILANDSVGPYLLKCVDPNLKSPFTSKHTLRELAEDKCSWRAAEETEMHVIRMMALNYPGMTLERAAKWYKNKGFHYYERLLKNGYFDFLNGK